MTTLIEADVEQAIGDWLSGLLLPCGPRAGLVDLGPGQLRSNSGKVARTVPEGSNLDDGRRLRMQESMGGSSGCS